jgi:hypothetical protein
MNIFIYCIPVQLSAVTPDEEPEPPMEETPVLAETPFRPVGRFGVRPATSTPAVYPRQLSFMDELAQKQREMGRSVDRPANFGCRPVEKPRVSLLKLFVTIVQPDPTISLPLR